MAWHFRIRNVKIKFNNFLKLYRRRFENVGLLNVLFISMYDGCRGGQRYTKIFTFLNVFSISMEFAIKQVSWCNQIN